MTLLTSGFSNHINPFAGKRKCAAFSRKPKERQP
jgi:hypothetical protein